MSKLLESPLVAHYLAATAGRNMTKAAYVAVTAGVVLMVLLTIDPAYMALHRWVDALLFACLVFFIFEWVVRLRQAIMAQRICPDSIIAPATPRALRKPRQALEIS